MKARKEIIPVVVNGVSRKAEIVEKQPENSIKLNVENSLYSFFEIVEPDGEDAYHWTYAVAK